MESFGNGPHTKVCPFVCAGAPHGVCRKCDRTLFLRNDDRCPLCRAARSSGSIARGGARPPRPAPEPDLDIDAPLVLGAFALPPIATDGFRQELADRLAAWMPRRIAQGAWRPGPVPASHGVGGYGGRAARGLFVLDALDHPMVNAVAGMSDVDDERDLVESDPFVIIGMVHRAAADGPTDGTLEARPDTSGDAALAAMLSDHDIASAFDRLRNMGGASRAGAAANRGGHARRRGGASGTV